MALDLSYSNEFLNEESNRWDILSDMETFEANLTFSAGLPWKSEVAILASFASLHDGFMDSALSSYHDALGVGNSGRDSRPDNEFAYSISHRNVQWPMDPGAAAGISDITASLNKQVFSNDKWTASIKGAVKIPTGDSDSGLGGETDFQLLALADWKMLDKLTFSAGAGCTWLGDPDFFADEEVSATTFGGLGVEYSWTDSFAVLCQATLWSSPYKGTGINALDDGYGEICFGGLYEIREGWKIHATLAEDLTRAAADFTFHLGFSVDI